MTSIATTRNNGSQALRKARSQLYRGFALVGFLSLFANLLLLAPPLYMLRVYDRVLTRATCVQSDADKLL